ncbi:MAG: hypothetical protein HY849_00315 [Nitrosomonadales bacterium]|nr:hypothetical protein [Nitrosomonadales bacterium]
MIHVLLTLAIVWLTYKTVTRGYPRDGAVAAAGTMAGLLLGLIAGFSFIAGGWWSLVGYALFIFTLASWLHNRNTLPEDIEHTLAEYEAMKPESANMR